MSFRNISGYGKSGCYPQGRLSIVWVLPICAILLLSSLSIEVPSATTTTTTTRTIIDSPVLLVEPPSYRTTKVLPTSQGTKSCQNGVLPEPFLHLPANETLSILQDVGPNDKYHDSHLRCTKQHTFRQPVLHWYDYRSCSRNETFRPARPLLIVQSAGFGTYAQLLDLTAPINKAYAQKWGHTMLVLQGTLVVLEEEKKTNCTPLEHRSTHNKMQLLKFGLQLRQHYDYLLILDADALIYDFSMDISDLMPTESMMAANRAEPKKGQKKRATWKINAGITLWNLHHPLTEGLALSWTDAALGYLNGRNNNQGDQIFLYHVLKNNKTMEDAVYSYGEEFHYNKATVIKHIKRPKVTYEIGHTALDTRSQTIATFKDEICLSYAADCLHLDYTNYSAT